MWQRTLHSANSCHKAVAMNVTSGKARQVAAVPHFHVPPSMRSCLRSRSHVFRARPRGFQPILVCNNSLAASTQQAGSLHPLIPTPNEVALGWLPASVLLMLQNFDVLGQFTQFAIYYGGAVLYITASVGMVHWYYFVTYHHAQHARGVTALTAVLASAGIMVASLAYRTWPMLSVTAAHQAGLNAAAACASWAVVATAWRVMQSICDVAATSFQQPELNMKEAEHFAQALDQAELRAFDDKLGPHDEAAQLIPPELKSMQSHD